MDEMEFIDEEMPLVNDDELFSESTKTNIQRPHLNPTTPLDFPVTRYENHGGAFTTGIDIFSREEKLKMEERAKRFGLTDKLHLLSDQEQDLYASMGIKEGSDTIKSIRFNVLHMRGTENMSTKDVFKYFEGYAPASIEWISDASCNVVWLDSISAARALLGLSKRILFNSNDDCVIVEKDMDKQQKEDRKPDNSVSVKDIHCPIPPGIWRKGVDHPKSKCILLRFANRSDKRQPNAEQLNEYYKKYGSPKSGGLNLRGIITESRKRTYKQSKRKLLSEDALPPNDPSKKMYIKNPWGDLSQNWGVNDSVEDYYVQSQPEVGVNKRTSVKERLGLKPPPSLHVMEDSIEDENNDIDDDNDNHDDDDDDNKSNSSSDSEEDWCKRSKVLRMRMHADDEEEKVHKRRARIQSQKLLNHLRGEIDLRSRLGRSKPQTQFCDTIQVVVTNPKASNTSSTKVINGSEEEDGEIIDDDEDEDKSTVPWIGNNKEQRDQIQDEEEAAEEEDEEEEEEEEEEEDEEDEEREHDDDRDDSDTPQVKEAQGPKGSVIKVVERKPRVASTVWARLNHVKSEISKPQVPERQSSGARDLRDTLRGGDLRSRIGNRTRGRSPLRIEVKNDKYTEEDSDSE